MSRRQVALDRPGRRLYNKNYKNPEKLAPAPKGQREATSVEYQVQMVYEREDVSALVRTLDFRRRPEKNLRRARKIGYRVFGVLLIAVAVFTVGAMVYAGVFSPIAIVTGIIAVCCLLGGVALLRRSDSKGMERRSWNKYPNKGMTITYTFYKDHFEEEDAASGKHEFPYLSIKAPTRTKGTSSSLPTPTRPTCCARMGLSKGTPPPFPPSCGKRQRCRWTLSLIHI